MSTTELRNEQWLKMLQFLRSCPDLYVGGEDDCRRYMEAILWMARSGAPWRLLPERYGNWNSIYKRFARWCEKGVWERMHQHFVQDPDMEHVIIDSAVVRAHPCAAGASKKGGSIGPSSWPESRRVQYQDPSERGWIGQPVAL